MQINRVINNIDIVGFKIFTKEKFLFRNLTFLTGENSSGKSSLIQAILYLGNPTLVGTPFNSDLHEYLRSLGQRELFNRNTKEIYIKVDNIE